MSGEIELKGWNGNPIDFFSWVTFTCQRGQKFADDFFQENVQAQCLPRNTWQLPDPWSVCVESKNFVVFSERHHILKKMHIYRAVNT